MVMYSILNLLGSSIDKDSSIILSSLIKYLICFLYLDRYD